ncbi:MAG: PorT family protein [Paramuribaculum sp.]|nr:PorT family protein [Paramuribaculum sp.]
MKKYIIRLVIGLIIASVPATASAQFISYAPAKKFVEVDVHLFGGTTGIIQNYDSKFREITDVNGDNGTGFGGGVGVVFGLREWLGFGTELNLLFARNKLNMAVSNTEAVSMSNIFIKNRYSYVNIPLFMSFRFNVLPGLRWNIDAGIYYAYGLSGRQKQNIYRSYVNNLGQLMGSTVETSTKYFKNSATFINSYRRSDLGLHLATAIQFGSHFYIGMRFQIGMRNVAYTPDGIVNPSVHNLNFTGCVGYKL